MLSAANHISSLKDKGYEFAATINSEPYFQEYLNDRSKYIYTGAIGKLLPFVFSAGVESHAVDPFNGLSSSMLSSAVTSLIEGNTELCDAYRDSVSPPPVCLKQYDIKPLYSVSVPCYSYAYYNYFTLASSPDGVLKKMNNVCTAAFDMVIDRHKKNLYDYSSIKHAGTPELNIEPKVITFEELAGILKGKNISVQGILEKYREIDLDTRDMTAYMVVDMLKYVPDLRPVMVIGFAPPYYPHRCCNEKYKKVMDICSDVIKLSMGSYHEPLIHRDFFPGLCDLSYLGFENPGQYNALERNMPAFNISYRLPVDALSSIDIAGINIGVMGKDAHKNTERLNISYSTKVTPGLVLYAITRLLDDV
jgi:arginine utilization protein RocB